MTEDSGSFTPIFANKKSVEIVNNSQSKIGTSGINWDENDKSKNKKKNLVISVSADGKVGKTRFIFTSLEVNNITLFGRNYGGGSPLYIIDLEGEAGAEYDHHFSKYENVHIVDPRVILPNGDIDYKKSFENINTLIDKLREKTKGTLAFDGFKFIDDCIYFLLVEEVTGKGFNEFGKPNKDITPTEQVWRKKQIWDLLTKLKFLSMPVILTNKVKKETASTTKFFAYTGSLIEDIIGGAEYFYDIKIRLTKEVDTESNVYKRIGRITDSRFEEERVPVQGIMVENPSLKKVIEALGGKCE